MTSSKRILGIVGSPRRDGNTEVLVDEVLAGAREAGATVEKVILDDLDILPCDACDSCLDTGECVAGDDMPDLLEQMGRADVWVIGTPVYWWGPSAQTKLFVDRWYCKSHRDEDKAAFRGKPVILAIPMGDSDPATARHTVGMLTDALKFMEARLFATLLAPGANDLGDVRKMPDLLATARRTGRDAVA